MKSLLQLSWKVAVVRGIIAVVFGLVLVIWPVTALVFVLLWGFWVLLDGIGWIVTGLAKGQSAGNRTLSIVLGVLAVIVAFFAIFSPGVTASTLIVFVGIWLIVRGLIGAVVGIAGVGETSRPLVLLGAALDLLLGILFFVNPHGSGKAIALVIGITAIVWGLVFVAVGLALRKEVEALPDDARVV